MSTPAYKNVSEVEKVLPTYNASVKIAPGQYVVGTFYSFLDGNNDYEKTADYTTLTWLQSLQIKYVYPDNLESETPVVPAAPGVVADGNGTTDSVAYWTDTNTLGALSGINVLNGAVIAVEATQFKLSALNTAPSSASDTGTLGEIRVTADAIYVCTATDTWVKATLATWA